MYIHVDIYYIIIYVVDIPEESDYVIMDTDLMLHRCKEKHKEKSSGP